MLRRRRRSTSTTSSCCVRSGCARWLMVPMKLGGSDAGRDHPRQRRVRASARSVDLASAEQIAARAAVAIENSRLYSERSRIARTLQQSLLPELLPDVPGYELASAYLPRDAGKRSAVTSTTSGRCGDSWMITIGDVTGKGVEAAALTAVVRHTHARRIGVRDQPGGVAGAGSTARSSSAGTLSVCTALCLRARRRPSDDRGRRTSAAAVPTGRAGWRRSGSTGRCSARLPKSRWQDTTARARRRHHPARSTPTG